MPTRSGPVLKSPVIKTGIHWHTMKLEALGEAPQITLAAWWDGIQVYTGEITDVPLFEGSGHVGFFAFGDDVDMTFDNIHISDSPTIDVDSDFSLPSTFTLDNNYPTPFNPSTNISYTLPVASDINLIVYILMFMKRIKLKSQKL